MLTHYGTFLGLRNARKHVGWYLEQSGSIGRRSSRRGARACARRKPERGCSPSSRRFYREPEAIAATELAA